MRPVWSAAYGAVTWAIAVCLTCRRVGAAAYVRGALAVRDGVFGHSDIDMAVVVPSEPRRPGIAAGRLRRRWKHLCRAFPFLRRLVDFAVYEDEELGVVVASSTLTAARAVHFGSGKLLDQGRLLVRPGLYGALHDWRLLRGPDRRPAIPPRSPQEHWIAGWLELQFLWRCIFSTCSNPSAPDTAYMCVKLIADPARIWLWLVHGEEASGRRDALERALRRIPEEEPILRRTLELLDALPRAPEPPLADLLPGCVRLSARLGNRLASEVTNEDVVHVALVRDECDELVLPAGALDTLRGLAGRAPVLLPLVDWRARAAPIPPDEAFCPVGLDPSAPADLAAAAAASVAGVYSTLEADGLMVLATTRGAVLRGVQCAVTDPVSFALARDAGTAAFPSVRGWSARDSARRAVVEHSAWLGIGDEASVRDWAYGQARSTSASVHAMGRLFTAARAALFAESVDASAPELMLTAAGVARRLGERSGAAARAAEDCYAAYRASRLGGRPPSARAVGALRELVLALPAYAPRSPVAGAPPPPRLRCDI